MNTQGYKMDHQTGIYTITTKAGNVIELTENEMQDRCGKFVENEVVYCISSLVEDLQEKELLNIEDFENLTVDNDVEIEELQEKIEELNSQLEELEEEIENDDTLDNCLIKDRVAVMNSLEISVQRLESQIEELEETNSEVKEIYEYWIVTKYFMNKLSEKGYCVCDSDYFPIWGRETTGQSILLDWIIKDMVMSGIIEYQ